jgi:hypothetical protein
MWRGQQRAVWQFWATTGDGTYFEDTHATINMDVQSWKASTSGNDTQLLGPSHFL